MSDTRIPARFILPAVLVFLVGLTAVTAAEAQTVAQTSSGATAATPAPLPNRLNTVLPAWLRLRGEYRARMEGLDNSGFVDGRDDLVWLGRLRVNATIAPTRWLSGQIQVQDARVADKEIGSVAAPFKAAFDVRTAFADLGAPNAPVSLRLGRQELVFGEQRLVGHVSWLNAARTFDGGRATVRTRQATIDVFATSVVRILPGEWDRSGNGNRFLGAYATSGALVPHGTVEPYFFWRSDRNVRNESAALATLRQSTAGVRWVGSLPRRFEYSVEAVRQFGSLGTDDISAWASHVRLRTPVVATVRFTGEYNHATGDADGTDGVRGTFDQLYPTPHDKYGLADQVGWRNIHHVRAGADLSALRGLPLSFNYHTWWLADRTDALYLAGGAPLARVAGGAASRHVGQEFDVQVTRALTPQLQLAAGYAYIRAGGFLKEATPGASYSSPYLMLTYVFFAEK